MAVTYQCDGPLRGNCKKVHLTPQEAGDHIVADHAAQILPGGLGFTDRQIVASDASKWALTGGGEKGPILAKKTADIEKIAEVIGSQP